MPSFKLVELLLVIERKQAYTLIIHQRLTVIVILLHVKVAFVRVPVVTMVFFDWILLPVGLGQVLVSVRTRVWANLITGM